MNFQQIINQITLDPKRIFLIDFIGAVVSTLLLGVVLVQLEAIIGMPKDVLYILAGIASIFAVYSFLCYRIVPKNWRLFLKIIAIANLTYCFTTLGLAIYLYEKLTNLGVLYFILECVMIVSLVIFELKIAKNKTFS